MRHQRPFLQAHPERLPLLPDHIPPRHDARILLNILRPDLDPHRHPLELVVIELPPRGAVQRVVQQRPHPRALQRLCHPLGRRQHRLHVHVLLHDRHHDDLRGTHPRRQPQPAVVPVRHDNPAHQPRAHPPTTLMHVLALPVLPQVLRLERPRKVIPEVMTRPRLQRPPVLHHRLDRIRAVRPRERLPRRLSPRHHRHRRHIPRKRLVQTKHAHRLRLGLLRRGMRRVPFLPEKLQRTDKRTCPHLPPMHVAPLVDPQRQITIRLNPLRKHMVDDRL